MAKSKRFTFFESYLDAFETMPEKDGLRFLKAVVIYGIRGEVIDGLNGPALTGFTMAKPIIDKANERRTKRIKNLNVSDKVEQTENIVEQSSRNVGNRDDKGSQLAIEVAQVDDKVSQIGDKSSNNVEQTSNKKSQALGIGVGVGEGIGEGEKKKEKKTTNGGEASPSPRPRKRFTPPTLDEWWDRWKQVGAERGVSVTKYEAEKAWSFYETNGWKQKNGNPVRSWKGALSTCFLNAHPHIGDKEVRNAGFSDATRAFDAKSVTVSSDDI